MSFSDCVPSVAVLSLLRGIAAIAARRASSPFACEPMPRIAQAFDLTFVDLDEFSAC